MWVTYKQANRGGLRLVQEAVRDDYEQVTLHRVYQTKVIPGLLQTAAMTTVYLRQARLEQGIAVVDVAEAVAARMDRQRVLRRPGVRWLFLLEECVLRFRAAPADIHAEQLRHLLTAMRMPYVSVGVIPQDTYRGGVCPEESFGMFDMRLVSVELISGYLHVTQPDEVRMYAETWERLQSLAVHGSRARALIEAALTALAADGT
jgi:hypothetical protein